MRTEVYSWRVSREVKSELEREARARRVPVSAVLDAVVRDWLQKSTSNAAEDAEQQRLHRAAAECLGTIESHKPGRAKGVRQAVRERLRRRHER